MANITVTGNEAYFNEDAKFFKDVYIYGYLYYDIKSFAGINTFTKLNVLEDFTASGISSFNGPVFINNDLEVNGITTFYKPVFFKDDITVSGISSFNGPVFINNNLEVNGISTFNNDAYFKELVDINRLFVNYLTVRQVFDVGIGGSTMTANTSTNKVGIGSTQPEQTLDVSGNVKFSAQLYDSLNSPGVIGDFLTKDEQGIKWITYEPDFEEGIFVYNDGVLVGVQSFRGLNLKTGRSLGTSVDPIQGFVNPSNSNIADIYVYDYWDFTSSGSIYRLSNVGINNSDPQYALDVVGNVSIDGSLEVNSFTILYSTLDVYDNTYIFGNLDVDGSTNLHQSLTVDDYTYLKSFLDVDGPTSINNILDVDGSSSFHSTLEVDGPTSLNSILDVDGATTLHNTLDVDGPTNINSILDVDGSATFHNTLDVDGPTSLNSILDVDGATTLHNTLDVDGATALNSTLDVDGATTLNLTLDVDGATTLNSTLDVDGATTLNSTLDVDFATTLNSTLDVDGATTLNSTLDVDGATTLNSTLDVDGATTLNNTLDVDGVTTLNSTLDVDGATTLNSTLDVDGATTLNSTLDVDFATTLNSTLDVDGATTLNNTLDVDGATTLNNTLDVDGATTLNNTLDVDGATTLNNTLDVDGATTLNDTLQVGPDGLVITTTNEGFIGFGTDNPSREIDFYNRDVFFNGGAIYDSNNNVGFRTENYEVPRNILATVPTDSTGNIIPGRFLDAANLIRLNLDFIANEAVGFITSIDYKNPAFLLSGSNYTLCKKDIKDIFKSITYDITKGGNSNSVGAGLSYYNGNTLIHINGVDANNYSIQDASIAAIEKSVEIAKFVINNSYYPTSYQMEAINGTYADAGRLILKNKEFIATEAVDRVVYDLSFTIPTGNQSCIDDIKLILDSIIYNLQFGGNSRVYDAAKFYVLNSVLSGEENQSIYAYEQVKTVCIDVIRNNTVTKRTGILNTYTQYKDLSVLPDPISPTCQNQASAINSFVGIVTNAIGNSNLPTRTEPTIKIPIQQIKDLTLADDPLRGSNTDPDGCANVVSAITVCAGIVTTIIKNGPNSGPPITYPNGKIVWTPPGADSKNIIYVSKYGNDDNDGRTEGSAKLTIGSAAEISQSGDTIMVRSGTYAENNPIGLRRDVTVSGQDLRLVTIYPQNDDDVFYVRRGCLIENLSFAYSKNPYDNSAPLYISGAAVAFPPPAGISSARSGYLEPGPADEGPTGRWRSPYIRNCTNFMSNSIGMKINGNHATASNIGNDLKCMVCDSFTQYNENGIGVSITNNGYAQLVSIFTINCNIAIYCDTGGACDLTNSNSSFGNYGLYAVGLGKTEYTGYVSKYPPSRPTNGVDSGSDIVGFTSVFDNINNARRPYDGQALFFKIDLNNYPDSDKTGLVSTVLQEPMLEVKEIIVTNGGSGYSASSPPVVIIRDADDFSQQPKGPQGIIAEISPNIDEETGEIISIDVVNSGRNYLPTQNLEVFIDGGTATATIKTNPIYYTISEATEVSSLGITTVTFNQFIPYELYGNEEVSFKRISRILTSSHSFEYIGTGVDINTSTPFQGAKPKKENEVVYLDGAQIPFTSTDQKGNFDIGEGFQINQPSSTIAGRDFTKAIQAEVTPLILALR